VASRAEWISSFSLTSTPSPRAAAAEAVRTAPNKFMPASLPNALVGRWAPTTTTVLNQPASMIAPYFGGRQSALAAGYGPWLKPPWPTGGSVYWGAAAMGSTLAAGRAQCKPADRFDLLRALRQVEKLQAQARGATMAPPLGPESPGNGPAGAPTLGVAAAICTSFFDGAKQNRSLSGIRQTSIPARSAGSFNAYGLLYVTR
jgi:hypothetical protein